MEISGPTPRRPRRTRLRIGSAALATLVLAGSVATAAEEPSPTPEHHVTSVMVGPMLRGRPVLVVTP